MKEIGKRNGWMRGCLGIIFALALLNIAQEALARKVMVKGRVVDSRNDEPIEKAQVTLGDLSSQTDSLGEFLFSSVPAKGTYTMEIVKAKYEKFAKNILVEYIRGEKVVNLDDMRINIIPPTAPEIVNPKGRVNSLRPTFSWKMAEEDWRVEDFDIEIDLKPTFDTDSFVSAKVLGESPNYTPEKFLKDSQKYFWRIRANLEGGIRTDWRQGAFEVPAKQPPGAPPTTTITSGDWDDRHPSWMPDGQRIVFESNRGEFRETFEIWLVTPGRGGIQRVTSSVLGSVDTEPCGGPGNTNVTFVSDRMEKVQNIWSVPTSSSLLTQRTNFRTGVGFPSWSTDGKLMVFSQRVNENLSYVWSVQADGSNLTQMVVGEDSCISPDGKRILFTSRRTGNYDIWKVDVDGANLMQITSESSDEIQPTWGHTGTYIVYVSDKSENQDLWAMNLETGKTTQLTNNLADDVQPACSPIDGRVVFSSNREGIWNLYLIEYKGETKSGER